MDVLAALGTWIDKTIGRFQEDPSQVQVKVITKHWREWEHIVRCKKRDELRAASRGLVQDLGWIVCAVLLTEDAKRDDDEVAKAIIIRWIRKKDECQGIGEDSWEKEVEWDRNIVFGREVDIVAKL